MRNEDYDDYDERCPKCGEETCDCYQLHSDLCGCEKCATKYDNELLTIYEKEILKTIEMRSIMNVKKSLKEIYEKAAENVGVRIEILDYPMTYDDLDWVDAAEAYDAGYDPKKVAENGLVALSIEVGADLSKFWKEVDRLKNK